MTAGEEGMDEEEVEVFRRGSNNGDEQSDMAKKVGVRWSGQHQTAKCGAVHMETVERVDEEGWQ